ncbi:MAG TPA: cyclic dehypoxanthinyl futalosine synthase [Bacteroidales bacterium]|nr:cyclic dehypoxanthinyl futalosine synthase [Bacteroidales bacterium]HPT03002.1 cyclic dehypoxanthinyl futalosine synthase [Bacteroidales bacterium]
MNDITGLLIKAMNGGYLAADEALFLYLEAPVTHLMVAANDVRKRMHPGGKVTWIIDRNVNYTNVCVSGCKFCNFYRGVNHPEAYITTIGEYRHKIDELIALGGNQLLLQGGMHPGLGLSFYTGLFRTLKDMYPRLKLHALGPPEVVHIAEMEKTGYREVLEQLVAAGLDSLPGAGAEILVDRVRQEVSPNKCTAGQWLEVMHEAHNLGLTTSATMMFGHVETPADRIQHLMALREVQDIRPKGTTGFISFIPWPFQDDKTVLSKRYKVKNSVSQEEYIRTIAISRLALPNIQNIQASWLTVGKETGQLCLHAGANDFGSIMIEENVVSVAGANHKFDQEGIQKAILEAGFTPQFRNQQFEFLDTPV